MGKKVISIISIIPITILGGIFFYDTNSINQQVLEKTLLVDAIYYENEEFVEITFNDNSQKTNHVILEILGLKDSYQKTFTVSSFVERIQFSNSPKYGWQIHPIVLVVDHEEFGKIEIKTEIHSVYEPPRPIIFSKR